jgi:GTP-binding protein EngB required for normal cell division
MRAAIRGRSLPTLDARLDALETVSRLARGRLADEDVGPIEDVLQRAGSRLRLGTDLTVVALAGPTGSGKSSLFNSLAGSELSATGVRRPTTATAQACVFGDVRADELLDWLGAPRRHHVPNGGNEGLVLLDLPDHDSTEIEHRLEVDRLINLVDLFVWVVDPQKYADAALHEGYLRPLATHAPVTLVALNQSDKLTKAERKSCLADLRRLLDGDGMRGVEVVTTSARTGEGVDELRRLIVERVTQKRAAADRLASDVDRAAERLTPFCGPDPPDIGRSERGRLTATLADAAGASVVVDAVGRSYRRDAALAAGWPVTRWLRRFRPDPLQRLHLKESTGGRTSLPPASGFQRAQVESAIRALALRSTEGLPEPWPATVHARASRSPEEVLDALDAAISKVDFSERRPGWWAVAGALQTLLIVTAGIGFLWLTVLFVLEWLQIPRPPVPNVDGSLPVPTVLLAGGLLLGFLFGALFSMMARLGAARRRSRANESLLAHVDEVAQDRVLGTVMAEIAAYRGFCDALRVAARRR